MFIDNENEVNSEDMDVSNNPFEEKNESDLDSENPEENNSNPDDECEKLRAELADLNNKYIRMAADFDNYRKRQAQERESLLKYGAANTAALLNIAKVRRKPTIGATSTAPSANWRASIVQTLAKPPFILPQVSSA